MDAVLHPSSQRFDLNWTLGIQTKHNPKDVAVLCDLNASFSQLLYLSSKWHVDMQVEALIWLYTVFVQPINP